MYSALTMLPSTWRRCYFSVKPGDVVSTLSNAAPFFFFPLTMPVVLLDEADVFLEERSLFDLQRNALVSGEFSSKIIAKSLCMLMSP